MSGPGASSGEMHGFPLPCRAGCELDEPLLDALLDRQPLPPDVPEQAEVVAEMLASLAASRELPGEAARTGAMTMASALPRRGILN